MPIANWAVPFSLTSAPYNGATLLEINQQTASGLYLLRPEACMLTNQVRWSKNFVPQQDGAILHRRFLAGMEMKLVMQLWEDANTIACDDVAQQMLDNVMGYLYGLLNAGDNEGRISWVPDGENARMLDDLRLLQYPTESRQPGSALELEFIVDCDLPYSEDLVQSTIALNTSGVVVTNAGNRPTYPVWKIYGDGSGITGTQTITNTTTGESWEFDSTQSGAPVIGAGDYIEINTFRNTAFKNGTGANCLPGMVMDSSDFFTLQPGANNITLSYAGSTGTALWNNAWA